MTRIFVISAIAFSVASSAWAQSGCYVKNASPPSRNTNVDTVCPYPNFTGLCVLSWYNVPASCPGRNPNWYVCINNEERCPVQGNPHVYNTTIERQRTTGFLKTNPDGTLSVNARLGGAQNPNGGGSPAVGSGNASNAGNGMITNPALKAAQNGGPGVVPAQEPVPPGAVRPPLSRPQTSPDLAVRRDPEIRRLFDDANAKYDAYDAHQTPAYESAARTAVSAYDAKLREVQAGMDNYQAEANANAQQQARDERNNPRPTARDQDDASECELSAKLDSKMGCAGTRKMMKTAEITNQIGQIGGTVATQIGGAQAQNSALSQGTQSAALRGAASVQGNTGKTQMMLGAVNAMMGWMQMRAGGKHEKNAKTINDGFKSTGGDLYTIQGANPEFTHHGQVIDGQAIAGNALNNDRITSIYELKEHHRKNVTNATKARNNANTLKQNCVGAGACAQAEAALAQREQELTAAVSHASREVSRAGMTVSDNAKAEQKAIADQAKSGGMLAMLSGAQQLGQGILNVKAAGQLNAAADQMLKNENDSNLVLVPPGQDAFPTTDPRTPTVITGNGAPPPGQDPASQDQTPSDDGTSPLGAGLPGPVNNAPTGTAPTPGKFTPGGGGGAVAGGGGIGGLNGGSTQAPGPDQGDKGPTAANPYVSGTTPVSGGGMMGPPPAGAKDAGINPADMLAQALGLNKPQEKDPSGQAYGARGPASTAGMGNGLGLPEEDIFKIVEGGYRRQIKAGNIGG